MSAYQTRRIDEPKLYTEEPSLLKRKMPNFMLTPRIQVNQ